MLEQEILFAYENIKTITTELFPVDEVVGSYWSTPETLTELSFGRHQESIFLRYQCGKAVDELYPHHNAANIGEFTKNIDASFKHFEIWPDENEAFDTIMKRLYNERSDDDYDDEEDFTSEVLTEFGRDLVLVSLTIALAKIKKDNNLEIAVAPECVFNIYTDYEDAISQYESSVSVYLEGASKELLREALLAQCESEATVDLLLAVKDVDSALDALMKKPDVENAIFG